MSDTVWSTNRSVRIHNGLLLHQTEISLGRRQETVTSRVQIFRKIPDKIDVNVFERPLYCFMALRDNTNVTRHTSFPSYLFHSNHSALWDFPSMLSMDLCSQQKVGEVSSAQKIFLFYEDAYRCVCVTTGIRNSC